MMEELNDKTVQNYSTTNIQFWNGRIDDPNDLDALRMHQIINTIDINKLESYSFKESTLNICLLGFCCDEGIVRNLGRRGAKDGPEYIRKEFANLPVTFGSNVAIYDAGDIFCIGSNMEEAQAQLELATKQLLDKNLFPIVLGGGHELALGHYNGITQHLKDSNKLGIINFDAHLDLRPYNKQGSSGTMFAQIADSCIAADKKFNYLCLGAQTSANTISLFKKADSLGAEYIFAKDFERDNYKSISKQITNFTDRYDQIYLTICSDIFDSASAPGVSAMQPFGMSPEVVLRFIKEILSSKKVISLDIAEVSPRFDQDKRTAKLVAVIIYSIINTLFEVESNN